MRWKPVILAAILAILMSVLPASASARQTANAYHDPAFGSLCQWHQYGEGIIPPWWIYAENPLCVEYLKRDITIDNGGAAAFLLAEPFRVAVAIPTCRYWQIDHWSVQTHQGDVPYVAWDGNYWFDKHSGAAGMLLQHFRINGVTAGVGDVVQALRPRFPALADALSRYGSQGGETGLTISMPTSWWC
ncbi:hypothetical protein [Kribbella ginsengisoli]|uniref:Uncharacterized protein n=1 Tax=Kribbella ginsengisoli TaxID=363865 RepID=A0ABP6Z802_9ACTN